MDINTESENRGGGGGEGTRARIVEITRRRHRRRRRCHRRRRRRRRRYKPSSNTHVHEPPARTHRNTPRTHARTHAHTHARTRTHTHTHTHTSGSARDSCRCSGPASKLAEIQKRSLFRAWISGPGPDILRPVRPGPRPRPIRGRPGLARKEDLLWTAMGLGRCAGTGHRTCSVTTRIRPKAHQLQARDRSVTARDQSVINSKPVIGP